MTSVFKSIVAFSLMLAASAASAQLLCEQQAYALANAVSDAAFMEPPGPKLALATLTPGTRSPLVDRVREEQGLAPGSFNTELVAAVRLKQHQLGLHPSGVLDAPTLLNMVTLSAQYRKELALNTAEECARINEQLQKRKPHKFLVVNVPSQVLRAYEYDTGANAYIEVLADIVAVGSRKAKTPLEDLNIWGVKFHPGWTPTRNILANSLIKDGAINQSWLSTMRVTNGSGTIVPREAVTVDNWKSLRFWQPPGDNSALGMFKFETDSNKAIYLHDTPDQDVFGSNARSVSSGCVRVANVAEIARWIFGAETSTERSNLFDTAVEQEKERTIRIAEHIPAFMSYQQVEFDANSKPIFFPDVYLRTGLTPSLR